MKKVLAELRRQLTDEIPPGPCLECDGSGLVGDNDDEICCECDGTGIAAD